MLDLYACTRQGPPLWADEYVLSADEKTSIQVPSPPSPKADRSVPGDPCRARVRAWWSAAIFGRVGCAFAEVFGRCEPRTGKAAFGRLVDQVMAQEPYRSARRVFWIVDNGSSHRGERAAEELRARHPRIVIVHTPVHASWLNQIDIYFRLSNAKCSPRMTARHWTSSRPESMSSVNATPRSTNPSPGVSLARISRAV